MLSYFQNILPRPRESLGIDVSDRSIECVVVAKEKDGMSIRFRNRLEFGAGVVEDGVVKDEKKLQDLLKKALSSHGTRVGVTVVGIPERHVYVYHFALSKVILKSTIKDSLFREAVSLLPFDLREHLWDYQIVREGKDTYEIVFVAVSKAILQQFKSWVGNINFFHKIIFEPESFALTRSIVNASDLEAGAILIIDAGARHSALYLVDQNGLQYSVGINHGGEETTAYIAEKFHLSFIEAEQRKVSQGFNNQDLIFIMQRVPQLIIQEANKLFEFYEGTKGGAVQKVLLTGGESLLPGFENYFSRNVEKPVLLVSKENDILFAEAMGLALRGFEEVGINLYPVSP